MEKHYQIIDESFNKALSFVGLYFTILLTYKNRQVQKETKN